MKKISYTASKLRPGDQVVVITGRDRGKTGTIDRVDRKHNRITVAGLNIYKRHKKADQSDTEAGIIEKTMPMDASNVAFLDPKSKKPTKLSLKVDESGKKVRVARKSGQVV